MGCMVYQRKAAGPGTIDGTGRAAAGGPIAMFRALTKDLRSDYIRITRRTRTARSVVRRAERNELRFENAFTTNSDGHRAIQLTLYQPGYEAWHEGTGLRAGGTAIAGMPHLPLLNDALYSDMEESPSEVFSDDDVELYNPRTTEQAMERLTDETIGRRFDSL